MQNFKFFIVACILCLAISASAQIKHSDSNQSNNFTDKEWQSVHISYHPMSFIDTGVGFTGFSLGYAKSISLSKYIPLYLEPEINFLWSSKKSNLSDLLYLEETNYIMKLNIYSINIPVNVGYRFTINDSFSIFPFAGMSLRINVAGTATEEKTGKHINLFSDKDMGAENSWNRVQYGGQIGVTFNINHLALTASYGEDFSAIAEDTRISIPSLSIGYNF